MGSLFGFSPVLMWTLFNSHTTSMPVAFAIALVVAALIGWFNGLFVTRLKIPSFLVTLGMLLVVRGVALFVTDGFPQRTWSAEGLPLAQLLVGSFYIGSFRIYASLFWFVGATIALGYLLTQTKAGNWIQATGGNAGAARARGVNVDAPKSRCSSFAPCSRLSPASSAPFAPPRPTPTAERATNSKSSRWW